MQLLEHIHGSYEVAFLASSDQICIKTFRNDEQSGASVSADAPGSAHLSTEMNVGSADFTDGYIFAGQEGEVSKEGRKRSSGMGTIACTCPLTLCCLRSYIQQAGLVFSVREVKAFLSFCEASECPPVTFYYHDGGRPVLFVLEDGAGGGAGAVTVELVLATMEPEVVADQFTATQVGR